MIPDFLWMTIVGRRARRIQDASFGKTQKRNGCGGCRLRLFAGLASFFVRCSAAICLRIHAAFVEGIARTDMSNRSFVTRSTSLHGGFRNNAETAARRIADSTQPCTRHADTAGVVSEI